MIAVLEVAQRQLSSVICSIPRCASSRDRAAGRLVDTARLHPYETGSRRGPGVPTPCLPPSSFRRGQDRRRRLCVSPLIAHCIAALQSRSRPSLVCIGRMPQAIDGALVDVVGRFLSPGSLQDLTFGRGVQAGSRRPRTALRRACPWRSGIWLASRQTPRSRVRELVRSHSRHGAITLISGFSA